MTPVTSPAAATALPMATPSTAPAAAARSEPARTALKEGEFLAFRLGDEEYAVDILRVQEIRSYEPPTRIAGAPSHALGVTNLRGVIVPILDLRARLGLPVSYDDATVTVVLNVLGRTVGVVVDSVSDVVELDAAQVKPAPDFSRAVDAHHITGIGTLGEGDKARMLILVDIEQLVGATEMGLVAATASEPGPVPR